MFSSLLIKETFDEFNIDQEKNKIPLNNINKKISNCNFDINLLEDMLRKEIIYKNQKQNHNFIENIEEKNYYVQDNEVKYKIFEDISSISKKNNDIELILNIPIENNIISINKIKLSNQLNKYIKNIYLNVDNKIIINKDEILSNREKLSKIIENKESIIKNSTNKNINLHIILDKNALNHIINKNIFVNYSYAIFKNKVKFL